MKEVRLSQVVAAEKTIKANTNSKGAQLLKMLEKPALFEGHSRIWKQKDESSEIFPDESVKVQVNAQDALEEWGKLSLDLLAVTLTKDRMNTEAKTDLIVGGKTILENCPVTYLVWLEKQIDDWRKFIDSIPVVDSSQNWKHDPAKGLNVTEPNETSKGRKVSKVIQLFQPTAEHPGQGQIVTVDEIAGYWVTVKHSGGVLQDRKKALQARAEEMKLAVKAAREEANSMKKPESSGAEKIVDYILNG